MTICRKIRKIRRRRRSLAGFLSPALVVFIIIIINEIRSTDCCCCDGEVIEQSGTKQFRCQRAPSFPYRHYILRPKRNSVAGDVFLINSSMTTRAPVAAAADNNEEIFTYTFPHGLEIKYEIFMTMMFCKNLITDDRDMAIKQCGHENDSVWENKEQGRRKDEFRSFLNHSKFPRKNIIENHQNSSSLMNSYHNRNSDNLNSEKAANYHHKQAQHERHFIKVTTLEAYFTIRKDVPLNRHYFLDTILLPISVLYCLNHQRRLATTIST